MELAPGLKHVQSVQVTLQMTPAHLRADPLRASALVDFDPGVEQRRSQAECQPRRLHGRGLPEQRPTSEQGREAA